MREIRIENVKPENLTHLVVALRKGNVFLLKEKVFKEMERQAINKGENGKMSFITDYGEIIVETVVELERYSDEFYKICDITVNGFKVYAVSPWVDIVNEIVVINVG